MTPHEFYATLAEQLIDNKYCTTSTRNREDVNDVDESVTKSGIGPHLTPTIRKRKKHDGTVTNFLYQGRCKIWKSGKKSMYVCSDCTSTNQSDFWVCHSTNGRDCFEKHLNNYHLNEQM